MSEPTQAQSASTVAVGFTAYGSLLGLAGGKQLAVVGRPSEQPALAVVLYRSPPYDLHVPALDMPRLSINLTASSVFGGIESERHRTFEAPRHSMFLTPPSAAVQWRKKSPSRHLAIYFRPQSHDDESASIDQLQCCGPIQREPAFLRRKQVESRTGLSRSTIYLYVKDGVFPSPCLSARARSGGSCQT